MNPPTVWDGLLFVMIIGLAWAYDNLSKKCRIDEQYVGEKK